MKEKTKKIKYMAICCFLLVTTLIAGYFTVQHVVNITNDLSGAIFAVMLSLFILLLAFVQAELFHSFWVVRFQKESRSKFNLRLNATKLIAGGVWLGACGILWILAWNFMDELYFHILEKVSLLYVGMCILINILTTVGWIAQKHSRKTA